MAGLACSDHMLDCPASYSCSAAQATIRGPGLVFILPFLENIVIIDIRTKVFEVPSQQILTTDSVTLTVDAVVYYRVFDPIKAAIGTMDYNEVKLELFYHTT